MKSKVKGRRRINRRQFVKQAGYVVGIGLGTMEELSDLKGVGVNTLSVGKTLAGEKVQSGQSSREQRKIIVSEDGPWWLTGDGRLTRRHLERFVEELAGAADTLALIMAMPDICFYPTKAGELFGSRLTSFNAAARMGETSPIIFWQQINGIRSLIESGNDPAVVLPQECHKRGIEAIARVKINDTHHLSDSMYPYRSQFVINNPQWHLRDRALVPDYSYREVRDHRLAIIQELVQRYDWDGLELDFTRSPYLFPSNVAEERAPIMTEFISQTRELLDKESQRRSKRRLTLGMRVPYELKICKKIGMDLPAWIKKGLVDYIAPGGGTWTEFNLKVEHFKALTEGTSCGLYPSYQGHPISSVPGQMGPRPKSREMTRAAAHNYYTWGADGLHFYNLHRSNFAIPISSQDDIHDPTGEQAHKGMYDRAILQEIRDPATLASRNRHYVFLPHYAPGTDAIRPDARMDVVILAASELNRRQVFPFRIAEDFKDARAKFSLRFKAVNQTFDDQIEVDLNGTSLPMRKLNRIYHWRGVSEWGVLPPFYLYEAVLTSPPAKKGDNELGVKLLKRKQELEKVDIYIQDVEVVVSYPD